MAKEIKQKIVLEGEKQYNAAIKEAQRNLKTLKSELKAETAELGKNATEQQKAEAKTKSLQKQIAEQEKIVKALREALQEVRDKYGDNAEETARWEQKLNNARATLANMKNDLDGVSGSFKNINTDAAAATVATKSVADAMEKIGSAGSSVSSAIENIFTGMIDVVTDAVGEVWDLISATAAKANKWTDIAGYWGTDAQTIQQYARAVGASANSFEDLQSAVSKIVLGGKGKKITELLGISDVNYTNQWDYAMAVMDQLEKMTASGKDMTPIYEQIFGEKKSTKIMDLVNDWKTIQELLPQFNGNETGYGMNDQELETMNNLEVKIATIEEKWQALKEKIGGSLGSATLDLLVNVEGTLDGIADYMSAENDEEREAALQKIRHNVEEFFRKLGEIIQESIHIIRDVGLELKESDDPLTSAIGDILVKLSEALQWMVDNQEAVKGAFEAIFGVWLIAKLTAVAGKLTSILAQIETIKAFKGLNLAGAGASGAAEAGAEAGAAGATEGGFFTTLAGVAGMYGIYKGFEWAADRRKNHREEVLGTDENLEASTGGSDQLRTLFAEWAENRNKLDNLDVDATEQEFEALQKRNDELWEKLNATEGFDKLWDSYQAWRQEQSMNNMDWTLPDWFKPEPAEEEESVDLDAGEEPAIQFTEEDRAQAVQDWWDAWRNAANGEDSWDEEASAFEWFKETFGDDFGDVWDRIIQKLDETKDQTKLEDLPEDWYRTTGNWGGSGTANENGITSTDLQGFRGLPANIQVAVQKGAAAGVSGIKVNLDGRTVGELVAPYVSAAIARDIV